MKNKALFFKRQIYSFTIGSSGDITIPGEDSSVTGATDLFAIPFDIFLWRGQPFRLQ